MIIPIEFVPGTHGHFLEIVLNKFFNVTSVNFDPFNTLGASHVVEKSYLDSRIFVARHWYEDPINKLTEFDHVISIQFDQDDLLLVSSLSLLRADPHHIDIDLLEVDTYHKLDNCEYRGLLCDITNAYPFLDHSTGSIPRNVLREFFKFGFLNPTTEGHWKILQKFRYTTPVFIFKFKAFYERDLLLKTLTELQDFLGMSFRFGEEFDRLHEKFLKLNQYRNHQLQCEAIISAIQSEEHQIIPPLTLLQESYINAKMENIYKKEMPFHNLNYFTSTKDMLHYIKTEAPTI
jgi:hypothetical protein